MYSKCFKSFNTFLILFSNKMFVFRLKFIKITYQNTIDNREDPEQTASSEAV